MSEGWENFDPAPIEKFHGEALKYFHREMKFEHDPEVKTCDGSQFSRIIAEFKMKIKKEYGISSDAIPKEK